MVIRSFFAIDSANMVVTSSSNPGIVGDPIINNSSTPNGTVFAYTGGGGTTITLDDTGGSSATFDDDDETNHVIEPGGGGGLIADGTEVESESQIFVRALDGFGNPTGPTITLYVFSQGGVTGDVWGFGTDTALVDGTSYVKTGGSNFGSSPYSDYITCFGPGTLIRTDTGRKPVEDIRATDRVWTRDHGLQPVRWAASSTTAGLGPFAPVVFAPGAVGNTEELVVSQQHRMLVTAQAAELLFGETEVFVAAKHLCGLAGVALDPRPQITYTHIMFDRHQIVESAGTLSESFFLSHDSVAALDRDARDELLALFPSLRSGVQDFGTTAAMTLKAHEATLLRAYL